MARKAEPGEMVGESAAVLINKVAQGDQQALGTLYDRFAGLVNGLALRLLRDPADAEDVVQTVFIQVWRHADQYDPRRGAPEAWLTVLARTRALDQLRRRAHRREAQPDGPGPRAATASGSLAEQIAVRTALARLPEMERRTLELAYFDGLSQTEIAANLSTPVGTVKTRTRNGMIRLRRQLGSAA